MGLNRRQFLGAASASAAGIVGASLLESGDSAAAATVVTPGQLSDIEHVVILMQENRSFDHYFGTLHGVRGYADPDMMVQADGESVLYQPDPEFARSGQTVPYVLPWRFDTTKTSGQVFGGLSHAWSAQHPSWNNALMDGFVASHRVIDDSVDTLSSGELPETNNAPGTMAYFTREDIPWQYALADAYTVCDAYHASVLGPTNPNRIMLMSGTVDPDGTMGGPCIDNSQNDGQLEWESYPEALQKAGIDWYLYQETDNFTDNMLTFFKGFNADKTSDLYRRGNSYIPTPKGAAYGPALIAQLQSDVQNGKLPQVSYIVGSYLNSEHPAATPAYGADFCDGVIKAIQSDPTVWAKTAIIINFDENDGFFDHVLPPTAPEGTAGEYFTAADAAANPGASDGFSGPVGLSFRVPMTIVSPFTRGGYCATDVFDHTSVLLFLERRFGVKAVNVSEWRRSTVGDLTSAFNFIAGADLSIPTLPDTKALVAQANAQSKLPGAVPPTEPSLPVVEAGATRPKPSGIVPLSAGAAAVATTPTTTAGTTGAAASAVGSAPATVVSAPTVAVAAKRAPRPAVGRVVAAAKPMQPTRSLAYTGGLPTGAAAVALAGAGIAAASITSRTRRQQAVAEQQLISARSDQLSASSSAASMPSTKPRA